MDLANVVFFVYPIHFLNLFSHSAIIEGCNKWLKDNSGMVAWKCETIERKVDVTADGSLTYDLDAMIRHDATFGYLVFVRGIR